MFDKIKSRMYEKKRKEREAYEKRRTVLGEAAESLGISIWGYGPDRGFDCDYKIGEVRTDESNNALTMFFDDGRIKLTVINPVGVTYHGKLPTIKSADKIIWDYFYRNKPRTENNRDFIEYAKIDESRVQVIFGKSPEYNVIIRIENENALSTIPGDYEKALKEHNGPRI